MTRIVMPNGSACVANQLRRTSGIHVNPRLFLQFRIVLWILVSFRFLTMMAQGGETNLLTAKTELPVRHSLFTTQQAAAQHERAGRKLEAAALYEEMARTNNAARKTLSHRLVAIYTETGETNKAVIWARKVMRENPDPQAYLAAVHARLGQWQEARKILESEVVANTNATRAVTLRWQLAEVCAKAGDASSADKALTTALKLAKGTPLESATSRRLEAAGVLHQFP